MNRHLARRHLQISLIAAAIVFAAILAMVPRERDLLSVSKRIASAQGWMIDRGPDECVAYDWISNREVLHLRQTPVGAQFFRLDLATGVDIALDGLSRFFKTSQG